MLSMYTGTVGSGKSYHALELGLQWIRRKKYVIANFPIKPPSKYRSKRHKAKWENMLKYWIYREEITSSYLMAFAFEKEFFGKENSCLVLIDEAGVLFNSRDWQHERHERTKWIKFLAQSRKFGYDFIFVCQMDRMIDRQIRGLVEYDVKHRKANNSIFLSWLGLFKISLFLYVYKWYGTKVKANLRFSVFKPWIANKYDTMKIFDLDELLESVEKIYEGKIIPAPVAAQIAIWQTELEEKRRKKEEERQKDNEFNKESAS